MKPPILNSERLIFKPISLDHLSLNYLNWLNDTEVNKYLESGGNYTFKLLKEYIYEQKNNNIFFWGIHLKFNNKHIGNIKIDPINRDLFSGEYGILMGDKSEWGKGYAFEASKRIIKYCFEELKLLKITLGVIEDNKGAVNLYNKLGFKVDEKKRNVGIYNDKLCNSFRMSIKANSFEK